MFYRDKKLLKDKLIILLFDSKHLALGTLGCKSVPYFAMDIRDSESSGSSDSSEEDISSPEPLIAAFQKVEHLKNVSSQNSFFFEGKNQIYLILFVSNK